MPRSDNPGVGQAAPAQPSGQRLQSFATESPRDSLTRTLTRPLTVISTLLVGAVIGVVLFLQQDARVLTLEVPEVRFELLPNKGLTEGVPIAIRMGHLMVFQISDPVTGAAGAARAKRVAANLTLALDELVENPPRVITFESSLDTGLQTIVQKEFTDSAESLPIVSVTADDMALVGADDPKLLARVWAERLTDSMRLLIFGEPPEFSRGSPFGAALDTLYVNAANEAGAITTDALDRSFNRLPDDLKRALTEEPPRLPDLPVEIESGS